MLTVNIPFKQAGDIVKDVPGLQSERTLTAFKPELNSTTTSITWNVWIRDAGNSGVNIEPIGDFRMDGQIASGIMAAAAQFNQTRTVN